MQECIYLDWSAESSSNRQGFGFWLMNSTGKLSGPCAAKQPRGSCLGCCTPASNTAPSKLTLLCWGKRVTQKRKWKSSQIAQVPKWLLVFPHKVLISVVISVHSVYLQSTTFRVLGWGPGFLCCLTLAFNHLSRLFGDLFLFKFLWDLSYM